MGNVSAQRTNGRAHTQRVAAELLDWSKAAGREVHWMWVLGPTGHHAAGRAIDFMTLTNNQQQLRNAVGANIAAYLQRNATRLGVEYIIWRQRIWNATRTDDRSRTSWSQWRRMANRGNPTANHMDHVHVSLRNSPPAYRPPQGSSPSPPPPEPETDVSYAQWSNADKQALLGDIRRTFGEILDTSARFTGPVWHRPHFSLSQRAQGSGLYSDDTDSLAPSQLLRSADYQARDAAHLSRALLIEFRAFARAMAAADETQRRTLATTIVENIDARLAQLPAVEDDHGGDIPDLPAEEDD